MTFYKKNKLFTFRSLEDIDNSIKSVMTELRVTNDPRLASEHEEFIANLNRKVFFTVFKYLLIKIDYCKPSVEAKKLYVLLSIGKYLKIHKSQVFDQSSR